MNTKPYIVSRSIPAIVGGILLLATYFLVRVVDTAITDSQENAFHQQLHTVEESMVQRSEIYVNSLRGGVALFEASDEVSRDEWKSYTEAIGLYNNFPGIQGFGFSEYITPAEKEDHIARIRAEGFPEYTIKPDGVRDEYTAITYLEPFDERNQQAFGYDMFSETTRRAAMQIARDSGRAQMSGRVTLVQEIDEDVQAGFLIYVPLYADSEQATNIESRREQLEGYVYAPFRAADFMEGITEQELLIDYAVIDGASDEYDPTRLMYATSDGQINFANLPPGSISTVQQITIAGNTWTLFAVAQPELTASAVDTYGLYIVGGGGVLFSILITLLLYILATSQSRAVEMANDITEDLRERNEEMEKQKTQLTELNSQLKSQRAQLEEKVEEIEKMNDYMLNREEKMMQMKEQLQDKDTDTV